MTDKQHDERCRQLNLTLLCDLDEGPCVGSDEAHLKRARELSMEVVNEVVADMPAEHPSQKLADEMATGFRALADLFQSNPDLAERARYSSFDKIMVSMGSQDDAVTALADFVRAAKAHGAKISKSGNEKWFNVDLTFGRVGLHVYAARDEVCERVVVGTREVTEEVPDPELLAAVPTTTVTRVEDIVEWQCKPLLAGGAVTE